MPNEGSIMNNKETKLSYQQRVSAERIAANKKSSIQRNGYDILPKEKLKSLPQENETGLSIITMHWAFHLWFVNLN